MTEPTNRYLLCNQMAETEKARKREAAKDTAHIWNSVMAYIGDDDIYYPLSEAMTKQGGQVMRPLHQIKRRAYYAMQSQIKGNTRATEFEAMYNLFEQALLKKEWRTLTRTQRETVTLVEMAKQTGLRESKFISNVLSITQNAANRRLRTLAERNAQFTPDFAIIEIKDALETTPRYCPFCLENGKLERIPNPKNSMCWSHHDRFVRRDDFGWYPRAEYERIVSESNATYWQKVRGKIDHAA